MSELSNQDTARVVDRRGQWRVVELALGMRIDQATRVNLCMGGNVGIALPVLVPTLGEQVWLKRTGLGIPQAELARRSGLSRWLIRQSEMDQDDPTCRVLLTMFFNMEDDV